MFFGGHIFIDLTVQISCFVTTVYNYLSKYTIEPDSRVPLFIWYAILKYIIEYDTQKPLQHDFGARTFDKDKSVPHFTSFHIATECTIRRPVYMLIFSTIHTSKTSFQIAEECTIK